MVNHVEIERVRDRLTELVSCVSFTGQEAKAIQLVKSWLELLGSAIEIDFWRESMSVLEQDPVFPGKEVERDEIPMLAARLVGKDPNGAKVLLTGHLDVAPIGETLQQWKSNPFKPTVQNNILTGRGSASMKGGIIAALEAFQFFTERRNFRGEVTLVVVSSELDGGCGTLAAIRRGYSADFAILPSPTSRPVQANQKLTGPSICVIQPGFIRVSVTVKGKPAHACHKLRAVSAFEKFSILYEAIRLGEKEYNDAELHPLLRELHIPYPISLGRVHGGAWTSTVVDSIVADFRVAVGYGETPYQALERFERLVSEASSKDEWLRENLPVVVSSGHGVPSSSISESHPLVQTVSKAANAIFGRPPSIQVSQNLTAMPLWSLFARTPAVIYGPGPACFANTTNESICLLEVVAVAKVLIRSLASLLQHLDAEIGRQMLPGNLTPSLSQLENFEVQPSIVAVPLASMPHKPPPTLLHQRALAQPDTGAGSEEVKEAQGREEGERTNGNNRRAVEREVEEGGWWITRLLKDITQI